MIDSLPPFVALLLLLLSAVLLEYILRKTVLTLITRVTRRTRVEWDDVLLDEKVVVRLIKIVPAVWVYNLLPLSFFSVEGSFESGLLPFLIKSCGIYVVFLVIRFVDVFLDALYQVVSIKESFRNRPLKGFFQILKISSYFIGIILAIGIFLDESPIRLLAGLGASAAVLMLIFKDSILGFVSGVQLSGNDMLRPGDWITVPKYGADGTVVEVTLNTVKVRNFDNTLVMLPPYVLVSDSFQNWRGMQDSAGRRIKRSINIDMNSVCFCTRDMLDKYLKIALLSDYIEEKSREFDAYNKANSIDESVLVNGMRLTNLGIFRIYLERYLAHLPEVNCDLTCMVRQLQPTERGIPLELYFFSREKEWVLYEKLQSDVFDHVLAVVREFDLHIYQSPSGTDLYRLQ